MADHANQDVSLVKVLSSDQLVRSLGASMTALVAFDIIIFFSEEFRLVWQARLTMGKLLYLYIRYVSLGLALTGFYGTLYIDPDDFVKIPTLSEFSVPFLPSCRILTQLYTAWACSFTLAIKVTQLVKTVAPYGDSPSFRNKLFVALGSGVVVIFGLSITLTFSYESIEYPFSGVSCALRATFPRSVYLAFYACTIAPDIAMCIACLVKFFQHWSEGNRKFATTIVRDSFIFTLVLTILAIPQFLTPILVPTHTTIIITGLNFTIIAIVGIAYCRMILNIRSHFGREDISIGTFTVSMAIHTRETISEMNFDCGGEELEKL